MQNSTLTALLSEIKQERQQRRRPLPMQPPATAAQVRRLAERGQQLPYVFPAAYLAVLSEVNGLDSNGILLYGTEPQPLASQPERLDTLLEGVVEANLLWREDSANVQYVFLAESGERLYGQNLATQKYESVDRLTKELTYAPACFDTCPELLALLFSHMLGRYPGSEEA